MTTPKAKHWPGMSLVDLKKAEADELAKAEKPPEATEEQAAEHSQYSDNQPEGHYRGHGIQVMSKPADMRAARPSVTVTYLAQVHDLRHPEADMGEGLVHATQPHHDPEHAINAAKAFVDHHLMSAFPVKTRGGVVKKPLANKRK